MENEMEVVEIIQTPKVVLDYKNNAVNAVITAVIGITLTSIAEFLKHKIEKRNSKTDNVVAIHE